MIYVREENLTELFARELAKLDPTEVLLAAMRAALDGGDEGGDKLDLIAERQAELAELEQHLEVAYEDRLAGRITTSFFEQKAMGWRIRAAELRLELEELQKAENGTRTNEELALELEHLVDMFQKSKDASKKRRLVEALHLNSSWRDGELDVEWKSR